MYTTLTWGYATTEINVYELIKISSMTLYYNFAAAMYLYTLYDYYLDWVHRTCEVDSGALQMFQFFVLWLCS